MSRLVCFAGIALFFASGLAACTSSKRTFESDTNEGGIPPDGAAGADPGSDDSGAGHSGADPGTGGLGANSGTGGSGANSGAVGSGTAEASDPDTESVATDTDTLANSTDTAPNDSEAPDTETEPPVVSVDVFELTLGGPDNPENGAAASIVHREVYMASTGDAKANAAKIDLIYYVGARDEALYSPNQYDARTELGWVANWSTYRDTKLDFSGVTPNTFDQIAHAQELPDAHPSGDVVGYLEINDIIAFETDSGERGLMKVKSLTTGISSTITLTVKMAN